MPTGEHFVSLNDEQLRLLGALSAQTGLPPDAILSDALRQYRPAPAQAGANGNGTSVETVYDALNRRGLIGCIKGGPADLSTTPDYMEGFGESDY
jgi:hypothetical protein